MMRKTTQAAPGFGRRGRQKAVVVAKRQPTSIERLQKIAARLWGKKVLPKAKKNPWGSGFKRSRLDP